ncbi:hypothetical protein MMO38_13930 [Acinetobacter sp. NIPH 1852]|nr:hypothetical protein [Acinetobacter sp. NIPH 1852]MBP8005834.1 hypothetical protein [Acinetobacter sp.]MCH7309221.1 hypothetical protein [Acinetobacter sp. NIPH 1852]
MIKQLKPVELPDDIYNWSHPDLSLVDPRWNDHDERGYTKEELATLECNAGIKLKFEGHWYEDIPEVPEEDGCDWSKWKPQPPSSEYFLIAAYDSEDGPFLWWAKPRSEVQQHE